MKLASATDLKPAMSRHRARHHWSLEGRLEAGVCVPLRDSPQGPLAWAIRRPDGLRHHSREIAFPGGKREPEDASLRDTAFRETEEELGLSAADLEPLGALTPVPTATSQFALHPFVALVQPGAVPVPAPDEVAALVVISFADFFAGRVPYSAIDLGSYRSPIFAFQEGAMYGATAHILDELLELYAAVSGLPMPPPARATTIPWA